MTAHDYPASWWAASARDTSDFPALTEDIETDVAIVGAGFTGLSAAHHLRSRGIGCAVLEAHRVGWGASGRNGGIAVPRYKLTFPELERKYGLQIALQMYRIAHDAVDTLEAIVREHHLDCGFSRTGHLTPVGTPTDQTRFFADIEWLIRHLDDHRPQLLDRSEAARKIGTPFYAAAYHEPRGCAVHPLEYSVTLANALGARGVRIYCETPVLSWSNKTDSVVLETPRARVKARTLLLASNAYSDLSAAGRRVRKRVVPVASAVIATRPLPAELRAQILPDGEPATDAKRLTNYYRVLRDGSFFFGGRGGASSRASQRIYDRLRRDMTAIFPQLERVEITHQWFGMVAVTLDSLPHLGSLEPNVHFAMGYNGRGVALAALLGRHLAQRAAGEPFTLGPITDSRFPSIPFHSLRVPAKQVALSWKQLMDVFAN